MEHGRHCIVMMMMAAYQVHITKLMQFTAMDQKVRQCVTKYMKNVYNLWIWFWTALETFDPI